MLAATKNATSTLQTVHITSVVLTRNTKRRVCWWIWNNKTLQSMLVMKGEVW